MKNFKFFDSSKPWYKGNLHTHTTVSDGRKSSDEAAAFFRGAGYDFICLTDHRKTGALPAIDGLLVIPGAEYDINDAKARSAWHITAINMAEPFDMAGVTTPGGIVANINKAGALAVLAHPAWSLLTHEGIMELRGLEAIEVFNGISEAYGNRGDSASYIDALASKGFIRPLLAVDDSHFYDKDALIGFTMVNTDDFTPDGVVDAIRAGRSYASQGPVIRQISINDGVVTVECGPLKRICFMTDSFWDFDRVADCVNGEPIIRAEYKIKPSDTWLRVEGEDFTGKKCWSNVIVVKER